MCLSPEDVASLLLYLLLFEGTRSLNEEMWCRLQPPLRPVHSDEASHAG